LNILSIGIACDHGVGWLGWIYVDAAFAVFFTAELVLRCLTFGCRPIFCGSDRSWNYLDLGLVLLAVFELLTDTVLKGSLDSNYSFLRVLRLARVTRLIRIMRLEFFSELAMMIQGASGGMKTFLFSCMMIVVPIFAFAFFMKEMVGNNDGQRRLPVSDNFDTLAMSMFTCFRCLVSGECADTKGRPIFLLVTEAYGWFYGLLYAVICVWMTFGLFNVIVAIFVENTLANAKSNDVLRKRNRLSDERRLAFKFRELIIFIATHTGVAEGTSVSQCVGNDMSVTKPQFQELLTHGTFKEILRELDVSDEDMPDIFETFDVDGSGTLTILELLNGIKQLRGDPKRSDVVGVSLIVQDIHITLAAIARNIEKVAVSMNISTTPIS